MYIMHKIYLYIEIQYMVICHFMYNKCVYTYIYIYAWKTISEGPIHKHAKTRPLNTDKFELSFKQLSRPGFLCNSLRDFKVSYNLEKPQKAANRRKQQDRPREHILSLRVCGTLPAAGGLVGAAFEVLRAPIYGCLEQVPVCVTVAVYKRVA